MDGVMPIVSVPAAVTGRNLLWRQMIIEAIKNDPAWQNKTSTHHPQGFLNTWPFAMMLLNGLPRLHKQISSPSLAIKFIKEASEEARAKDAVDVLYALNASSDYNPEPNLNKIKTKVFALGFTDDQLNPVELNILKNLIKQVKNGRAVLQEGNELSFGHLTMAHPELWAHQVKAFISLLNEGATKFRAMIKGAN